MHTEEYRAHVQYDDCTGTVAADDADSGSASDWLRTKGLSSEDEFLVGIQFYVGAPPFGKRPVASVEFLLTPLGRRDSVNEAIEQSQVPLVVRRVQRDMPLEEFFSLFKRFKCALSGHGLLHGRQVAYTN
jgi:hypothetical protein